MGPSALGRPCRAHLGACRGRPRLRADAPLGRSHGGRHTRALVRERRGDDGEAGRLPDTRTLGDSWGLGWIRYGWDGERLIGHDGTTLGQAAFLRVLPSHGLAVSLLTNGGHTTDLARELLGEVFAELAGLAMPAPVEPATTSVDVDPRAYAGRYERAGLTTEVFEGDEGLVLRSTVTGPLAALLPEPVHEYPLAPVEPGVFAIRAPGTTTWLAVTFYALADGARYVHYGARANPLVAIAWTNGRVSDRSRTPTSAKSQCGGAADAFRDVPRRRRGSSGGIRLLRNPAREQEAA